MLQDGLHTPQGRSKNTRAMSLDSLVETPSVRGPTRKGKRVGRVRSRSTMSAYIHQPFDEDGHNLDGFLSLADSYDELRAPGYRAGEEGSKSSMSTLRSTSTPVDNVRRGSVQTISGKETPFRPVKE